MNTKGRMEMVEIDIVPGERIDHAAERAITIARERDIIVKFIFNEIEVSVTRFSTKRTISDQYYKKLHNL